MNPRNRFDILLAVMFIWGAFSSVIIAILVRGGVENQLIFGLKDAVIYLLALGVGLQVIKDRVAVYSIAFISFITAYLVINYLLLNPSYAAPLNNIRQIVSPMVLMLIFLLFFRRVTNYKRLAGFVLVVHTVIFFFGVFEFITEFWKEFGLHNYFLLKGIPVDSHGVSYMFYEPMMGFRLRMTSTMIDPISAGHYFATMLCFAWFVPVYSERVKGYLVLSSLIGLLLCFSKGAFLQAFLMLLIFNHRVSIGIRAILIVLPFAVVSMLPDINGILIHLRGGYQSLVTMTFWGHGIGSVGNYAAMFSDNLVLYHRYKISDTFLGALLGQVGLFGLTLWLLFMFRLVYLPNSLVPLKLLATVLIVSAMSENTLNVTSFVLPASLIAWSYAHFYNERFKVYFAVVDSDDYAGHEAIRI